MLTKSQIKQVIHSYKHGEYMVVTIGDKVFVCEEVLKHPKEATVELRNCQEVDESCFEPNGEYYGETLGQDFTYILDDPCADQPELIATVYYSDEIKEVL